MSTRSNDSVQSSPNPSVPAIGLVVSILVLASSTSIMSTDMYTPSLPDMVSFFGTTPTLVQLTISLNMVAFGLAQLLHGPLSDRFGRKPVLIGSLLAVSALSLSCAAAQSIEQLIVARVFLGVAAAAEAVIGLAILKDLYTEREQMKALALLGMVIAITPALAPILGGFLHVHFGWQSNFFVIALMAMVSLGVIVRWLPESTTPDALALQWRGVVSRYRALLHNAEFITHSLILGMAMGVIFVFVTGAPFLLIERLGVAPNEFGFYQAAIVLSFFFGSLTASRLAERWQPDSMLTLGVVLIVSGALGLLWLVSLDRISPLSFVAVFAIMTFGMGPLFAMAPSRALRSVNTHTGSAAAMLSGLEQGIAGLSAVALSLLHNGTAWPLVWVSMGLCGLLLLLTRRSRRQSACFVAAGSAPTT